MSKREQLTFGNCLRKLVFISQGKVLVLVLTLYICFLFYHLCIHDNIFNLVLVCHFLNHHYLPKQAEMELVDSVVGLGGKMISIRDHDKICLDNND